MYLEFNCTLKTEIRYHWISVLLEINSQHLIFILCSCNKYIKRQSSVLTYVKNQHAASIQEHVKINIFGFKVHRLESWSAMSFQKQPPFYFSNINENTNFSLTLKEIQQTAMVLAITNIGFHCTLKIKFNQHRLFGNSSRNHLSYHVDRSSIIVPVNVNMRFPPSVKNQVCWTGFFTPNSIIALFYIMLRDPLKYQLLLICRF